MASEVRESSVVRLEFGTDVEDELEVAAGVGRLRRHAGREALRGREGALEVPLLDEVEVERQAEEIERQAEAVVRQSARRAVTTRNADSADAAQRVVRPELPGLALQRRPADVDEALAADLLDPEDRRGEKVDQREAELEVQERRRVSDDAVVRQHPQRVETAEGQDVGQVSGRAEAVEPRGEQRPPGDL